MDLTNFYSYSYSTTSLAINLNRTYAYEILAKTSKYGSAIFYLDNVNLDVQIRVGNGFLHNIPDINNVSDLRVKILKYIASPYIHLPDINRYIESEIVVFELTDIEGTPIPVDISGRIN